MTDETDKFDRATRRELGVPKTAFLHAIGPSTLEARIGVTVDPVATAVNEGQQWIVRTATETMFVGGELAARRLLWAAVAAVPGPPPASRPAPRRVPFDHYNRID